MRFEKISCLVWTFLFLFSILAHAQTTATVVKDSNGNIGIGTSGPISTLQVAGTLTATAFSGDGSLLTGTGANGWTDGGTNIYTSTITDNVAIGTSIPTATLLIENTSTIDSLRVNDAALDATPFIIDSAGNVGIATTTAISKLAVASNASIGSGAAYITQAAPTNGLMVQGNVGIGTFATVNALSVYGSTAIGANTRYPNTTLPSNSLSILGNLGIGTYLPNAVLDITGTYTNNLASPRVFYIGASNTSSNTTDLRGFENSPQLQPTGASIGTLYGLLNTPTLSGGTAIDITSIYAFYSRFDTGSGYAGTATNVYNYYATTPTISGTNPFTNLYGYYVEPFTNGNGITSGTVTNWGFYSAAHTAAAASGGIIANYGAQILVPSGSGAGTTSNYGLRITGNGGSGGAGTTTNYSISNESTAISYFNNNVGIGTTIPGGGLVVMNGNVGIGTWNPAAGLEIAHFSPSLLLRGAANGGANATTDAKKLYINNYDNDGTRMYPIYVEDENNGIDFFIRNRATAGGVSEAYFQGNVGIGTYYASASMEIVKTGSNIPLMVSKTATSDGDYLLIDSAGNVGIGTTKTTTGALSILNGNVGIGTWKPSTILDVNGTITATLFGTSVESQVADCTSNGCTATATCSSGKNIIFGLTSATVTTCDTNPSTCSAFCTLGTNSCAIAETGAPNAASVYIVCGKIN